MISIFKTLEQGIRNRSDEADVKVTKYPYSVTCKPIFEWESVPAEDRGSLLNEEVVASYLLGYLYKRANANTHPKFINGERYACFGGLIDYPKAQLCVLLERAEKAIQSSFTVEGDKVIFSPLTAQPDPYDLHFIVQTLLGKTPSGFSKITHSYHHGKSTCSISRRDAEKIAPFLGLTLGKDLSKT